MSIGEVGEGVGTGDVGDCAMVTMRVAGAGGGIGGAVGGGRVCSKLTSLSLIPRQRPYMVTFQKTQVFFKHKGHWRQIEQYDVR